MLDFLIEDIIKECSISPFFCFSESIKPFLNIATQIHYIDTSDIATKEKTFETMRYVAKILNIPFNSKLNEFNINYSSINLPETFFPYSTKINLKIDTKNSYTYSPSITFYTDSQTIEGEKIKFEYFFENKLKIYASCANKKDIFLLEENLAAISEQAKLVEKEYLCIQDFIKNGGFEKIILMVFKHDPKLKNRLQVFIEPKIAPILQDAPHIFKNWIYYQDFLKL